MLERRSIRYALAGAMLSAGAPLGWLCLRAGRGAWNARSLSGELHGNAELYAYLLIGCAISFTAFGARLGVLADRLARADALHTRESITDALTGLYNPRYFHRRLAEEIARADRSGRPLGLVMIDLDQFKQLNDRFGHPTGDRVLSRVGALLLEACRASDLACRIGGEEFAVLCPDTGAETAFALAERLRQGFVALPLAAGTARIHLTASLGAGERTPGERAEALVDRVDRALYEAKTHGRNQVARASRPRDLGPGEAARAQQ